MDDIQAWRAGKYEKGKKEEIGQNKGILIDLII